MPVAKCWQTFFWYKRLCICLKIKQPRLEIWHFLLRSWVQGAWYPKGNISPGEGMMWKNKDPRSRAMGLYLGLKHVCPTALAWLQFTTTLQHLLGVQCHTCWKFARTDPVRIATNLPFCSFNTTVHAQKIIKWGLNIFLKTINWCILGSQCSQESSNIAIIFWISFAE